MYLNLGNIDKNKGQKLGLFIFECVMAVFYVCLSIIMLFAHWNYFNNIDANGFKGLRIAVGIVIGIYGLFRIYRAYVKIKERDE